MENTELQVQERAGFIRPLLSVDQAVEAFNQYQTLKTKLRADGDFIQFTDRKGNKKEAPTKAWRSKLTRFFGISVEVIHEDTETLPDGSFLVKALARASAPNGLYMVGDGSCWSKTKNDVDQYGRPVDIYHNTRSHAITRAKNRAVLELVGFGEVSAEEISGELETPQTNGNGKPYPVNPPEDSKPKMNQKEFILKLVSHWNKGTEQEKIEWLKESMQVDLEEIVKDKGKAAKFIDHLKVQIEKSKETKA